MGRGSRGPTIQELAEFKADEGALQKLNKDNKENVNLSLARNKKVGNFHELRFSMEKPDFSLGINPGNKCLFTV